MADELTPPHGEEARGSQAGEEKSREFPCTSCGADLEFSIGVQTLKCPYCGAVRELEPPAEDEAVAEQDFHAMLERLVELRKAGGSEEIEGELVRCTGCGAEVTFSGVETSSSCPYCDSPIQRVSGHEEEHRVPVDGVLPFKVERQAAQGTLRRWIKSLWFAPNAFKKRGVDGKFNGVYLPFWTFDSMTFTRYKGERGEHYWVTVGSGKNRSRQRRTRWYPASGSFQHFFDDYLETASRGLPDKQLRRLEPWPFEDVKPFNPQLLAGYAARTYEIGLEPGFGSAKLRMEDALRTEVRRRIGGDTQRIHNVDSRYSAVTYKHLLLPAWLLAYRYSGKVYRVVVNAATGEIQGERPWSAWKIFFLIVTILAIVGFFWAVG